MQKIVYKGPQGLNKDIKTASKYTVSKNYGFYKILDFSDKAEYERACRGLIESPDQLELTGENGLVIWSQKAYTFVEEFDKAPDTVNPSLWENTKNNHVCGLFKVVDGIYQIRGYDMANLTLIEGETGWIVYDTTMSVECAAAGMQLVEKHFGKRPVKAVLISHPHVDHFGGMRAFVDEGTIADSGLPIEDQLASGKIPVIVPEHFAEHAVSENLYAGAAMGRRANYMYGTLLEKNETGSLAIGIGMGQSRGTVSFLMPTYEVTHTGQKLTIDGVEMEFHMTPGTEAPAEMNTWFPQFKALWAAENCTGTLHNLYTLRGAQIRDGNSWANYIMEAEALYGSAVEVIFQSHNWPHWGKEASNDYLIQTAAIYKYINDQTLTYINQGYTADEIAHKIKLPKAMERVWYTRQYYGTLVHDAKAVYQRFMGWYDANPVHLNKLPPENAAKKLVEYLGDIELVLQKAKEDFDKGQYQWVAEITNALVYADPENEPARLLCADALEQLGYQAEAGTWRNCYLTAALELRHGNMTRLLTGGGKFGADIIKHLTSEMMFNYMGILLDKEALEDERFTIGLRLFNPGSGESEIWTLYLVNGTLLFAKGEPAKEADVIVTCGMKAPLLLIGGKYDVFKENARIQGRADKLELLAKNLNQLSGGRVSTFNIIEP